MPAGATRTKACRRCNNKQHILCTKPPLSTCSVREREALAPRRHRPRGGIAGPCRTFLCRRRDIKPRGRLKRAGHRPHGTVDCFVEQQAFVQTYVKSIARIHASICVCREGSTSFFRLLHRLFLVLLLLACDVFNFGCLWSASKLRTSPSIEETDGLTILPIKCGIRQTPSIQAERASRENTQEIVSVHYTPLLLGTRDAPH